MKLPPNFQRVWVKGNAGSGNYAANGWNVQAFNKAAFIPRKCVRFPGGVRSRLEAVLGIVTKPQKTEEQRIVGRSRTIAANRRNFRNKIAAGTAPVMPWELHRTVRKIKDEERVLAIINKWQRMGEYRK